MSSNFWQERISLISRISITNFHNVEPKSYVFKSFGKRVFLWAFSICRIHETIPFKSVGYILSMYVCNYINLDVGSVFLKAYDRCRITRTWWFYIQILCVNAGLTSIYTDITSF